MTFLELVKKRYSSRSYLPKAVEAEKLDYILECGRLAPSAANFQPWYILVIQNKNAIEKISAAYPRDWFKEAPVILVICGDHQSSWKRADGKDHCDIDVAIITDHITLAAAEQDLATCWICNFDLRLCRELLDIPAHLEPSVILTLGYPADTADTPRHNKRKNRDEIIHKEKF